MITELQSNERFVYGSNTRGINGAGAALYAKKHFGAVDGVGSGPTGQCYAIPTKDHNIQTLPLARIRLSVSLFLDYAFFHPELTFLVTPIGTGLAGYKPFQIASMFKNAADLPNVVLPDSFQVVLDGTDRDPGLL